jgi:anti-sigma factor RsiW
MCEQREQLIGYLYEEGDAAERAAVRAHLDECADCRAEIAGFRTVQDDLRAWEVPDHESVWRPFTPVTPPSWWRQVPSWALAAAAGLVIASGATGGAVAYLLAPQPAPAMVRQSAPAPTLQNTSAVTSEDLAAAEARVMERVRLQFAALETQFSASSDRVLTASNTGVPGDDARLRQIEQQMSDLRKENEKQFGVIMSVDANIKNLRIAYDFRQQYLLSKVNSLTELVTNK